jgi:thioredoxin 1
LYGGGLGLMFAMLSDRDARGGAGESSSAAVKEINEAEFESAVIQSARPVLVDFYAPWCGPCKRLSPVVGAIASEFAGHIDVVKVNVDEAPNLAARYNVRGVPTLMIFDGGQSRDTMVGLVAAEKIRTRLQPFVINAAGKSG